MSELVPPWEVDALVEDIREFAVRSDGFAEVQTKYLYRFCALKEGFFPLTGSLTRWAGVSFCFVVFEALSDVQKNKIIRRRNTFNHKSGISGDWIFINYTVQSNSVQIFIFKRKE